MFDNSGEEAQFNAASASNSNNNTNNHPNQLENIKVAVRLRPFTEKEKQRNNKRIVDIEQNTVVLYSARQKDIHAKRFTFDYSYWSHDGFRRDSLSGANVPDSSHLNGKKYVSQEKVFEDLGEFLLINALQGYNSALLAYGQTGSGKSYTVSGYGQNEGILPRFARALFQELDKKVATSMGQNSVEPQQAVELIGSSSTITEQSVVAKNRYEVFFSMIEIYNEVVRDLLAKNRGDMVTQSTFARRGLKVREHPKQGFFVEKLTSYRCADKEEIEQRIEEGQLNKSIAATSMNETSSRGHTIYEFKIKQYKLNNASNASEEETLTTSVVQLVDLAGSERTAVHNNNNNNNERIGLPMQQTSDFFSSLRSKSPGPSSKVERLAGGKQSSGAKRGNKMAPNSASSSSSALKRNVSNNLSSLNANTQQRFKESVSINQSLSALGNCIQVMSQYSQQLESSLPQTRRPKIPYRDSVLTKLLNRCCLSGNSKVVIIATLSPADINYDDTLSTLRFADRAKQIRTHAMVNRMSRSEMVDTLQRENERLKQIVDGRVTRSDDSSQTSNFDDTENVMENFTGSRIQQRNNKTSSTDIMATPLRSRTTIRKSRVEDQQANASSIGRNFPSASSNLSLKVKRERDMERLVSPAGAGRKSTTITKSRSLAHVAATQNNTSPSEFNDNDQDEELLRLHEAIGFDELDLNDLGDIKEGLISPESEDSFAALADEELTTEEKIGMFNRLLSNSTVSNVKMARPKRASKIRAGIREVAMLSSSLRKTNPYLSNLNPDEQLTGMISYIIKHGEAILGKSSDCDIMLHGPELRGHHAKMTRISEGEEESRMESVYIEPILDQSSNNEEAGGEQKVAIMVNGSLVLKKTRLNHCDRLLFGTNAYFVFVDNVNTAKSSGTIADPDLVTFDMAKSEVLRKVMSEAENEAMIKEIKHYTHRPGTGKHKAKQDLDSSNKEPRFSISSAKSTRRQSGTLNRSVTMQNSISGNDEQAPDSIPVSPLESEQIKKNVNATLESNLEPENEQDLELKEDTMNYRDQLMEDTYEYAMPVAEVNAVAKEMAIKVTYGLKILTGEEQLSDQLNVNNLDSNNSENSSSTGDNATDIGSASASNNDERRYVQANERITRLVKIDGLDIPPALYIKVHHEELDLDFYWSKEKFQDRRYKILELYGPWDVGGKSGLVEHLIDQSRVIGSGYLIDPFIDDPSTTFVLIGNAQITLQQISHRTDIRQEFELFDLNDEIIGNISIEVLPCHNEQLKPSAPLDSTEANESSVEFAAYNEQELKENLLNNPKELLNEKLVFLFKIKSCKIITNRYVNIFCQYTFNPKSAIVRTKFTNSHDEGSSIEKEDKNRREEEEEVEDVVVGKEFQFNHSHYVYCEKVNEEILEFLQYGFLTIQVVGQYKLAENATNTKSATLVTTIINSINKYKFKMEQQGSGFNNYSSSSVYNHYNNVDSAKSNRDTSGIMNSNSSASSVASTSATVNLFDQQNEDEEGISSINGVSQENVIDMILTKRKLDRAENQLHYLKRTVNIAEHYNKKHIPVKTVKKLLNSYGRELDSSSLEEMTANVTPKGKTTNKHSACVIQ